MSSLVGEGRGPSFEEFESPLPNYALCKVLLKLVSGSGEEVYKFCQCIFATS